MAARDDNPDALSLRHSQDGSGSAYDQHMVEGSEDDATAAAAHVTGMRALADDLLPIFYEKLRCIGRRERGRIRAGDNAKRLRW